MIANTLIPPEIKDSLLLFMDSGGFVLWVILLVSIILWTLVMDRLWMLYRQFPNISQHYLDLWHNRTERCSWQAHRIRDSYLTEMDLQCRKTLPIIHTLVTLLPILGLLGTVIGMIHTFEVLTLFGTGNARALAASISTALITTMAGLVMAIPGLFVSRLLTHRADHIQSCFADQLTPE